MNITSLNSAIPFTSRRDETVHPQVDHDIPIVLPGMPEVPVQHAETGPRPLASHGQHLGCRGISEYLVGRVAIGNRLLQGRDQLGLAGQGTLDGRLGRLPGFAFRRCAQIVLVVSDVGDQGRKSSDIG